MASCTCVSTSVMRTDNESVRSLVAFSRRSISIRTSIASPTAVDILSLSSSSAALIDTLDRLLDGVHATVGLDEARVDRRRSGR